MSLVSPRPLSSVCLWRIKKRFQRLTETMILRYFMCQAIASFWMNLNHSVCASWSSQGRHAGGCLTSRLCCSSCTAYLGCQILGNAPGYQLGHHSQKLPRKWIKSCLTWSYCLRNLAYARAMVSNLKVPAEENRRVHTCLNWITNLGCLKIDTNYWKVGHHLSIAYLKRYLNYWHVLFYCALDIFADRIYKFYIRSFRMGFACG